METVFAIAFGIVLKALAAFLLAIPMGMGLCIGFTTVKNWYARRKAKRLSTQVDDELLAASAQEA